MLLRYIFYVYSTFSVAPYNMPYLNSKIQARNVDIPQRKVKTSNPAYFMWIGRFLCSNFDFNTSLVIENMSNSMKIFLIKVII